MKIKIFGERNTGTNAFTKVLDQNSQSFLFPGTVGKVSPLTQRTILILSKLRVKTSLREALIDNSFKRRNILMQWKHAATYFKVDESMNNVHFVFLVRNPLSWLISLYKNPYHIIGNKPDSLIEFSTLNWKTLSRDNLPNKFYLPLDLYLAKLESYIYLARILEKNNITYSIVKFENFVSNQKSVFNDVRPFLNQPSDSFVELKASTKELSKGSDYYSNYYSKELWRQEFPEIENVALPQRNKVYSFFGYD